MIVLLKLLHIVLAVYISYRIICGFKKKKNLPKNFFVINVWPSSLAEWLKPVETPKHTNQQINSRKHTSDKDINKKKREDKNSSKHHQIFFTSTFFVFFFYYFLLFRSYFLAFYLSKVHSLLENKRVMRSRREEKKEECR